MVVLSNKFGMSYIFWIEQLNSERHYYFLKKLIVVVLLSNVKFKKITMLTAKNTIYLIRMI